MTLNPRQRFKENNALSKGWDDFVVSTQFEQAAQAAMWAAEGAMPPTTDMGTAAANEFRRQGMRLFLDQLMNLCQVGTVKATPPTVRNLDHTA